MSELSESDRLLVMIARACRLTSEEESGMREWYKRESAKFNQHEEPVVVTESVSENGAEENVTEGMSD